ncbi:PLC-like phosphodiesterase [Dothidotthia symphoricarpi CBS 119687]|uniref:Phosphoinositide phospholipase C n=1 Tax=Dothidotthia symphoricarpi CBS 119687 TaxID=1392245 RepID=A0A6A6APH5_9PLEO|nr:PLC-like phosphodiesterase [Dothidotthia symphoricarpi CBS 119687]KAF2133048.1 PLC-like phosphodiesterase [Dothidotthia symphoricarpi CBS 119687]
MTTKDPKLGVPKLDVPQLQAGGGIAAGTTKAREIDALSPLLVKHLRAIHSELETNYRLESMEGQIRWLAEEQQCSERDAELLMDGSFPHFADYFLSGSANAVRAAQPVDESYPLSNYFISSSHNTYLTGNQLASDSSADAYKNVLLRGCRCVEIDVHDGSDSSSDEEDAINSGAPKVKKEKKSRTGLSIRKRLEARFSKKEESHTQETTATTSEHGVEPWRTTSARVEPRVYHGYTMTSDMPFRAVCATIRDYAFQVTKLPLIVSIEVHANYEQQEIMVELMNEYWQGMLIGPLTDPSHDYNSIDLPTLKELEGKILVKVKRAHTKPVVTDGQSATLQAPASLQKTTSAESTISTDTESEETGKKAKPKPKLIDTLSMLGVYFGGYHFKSLDAPEATIPTHIFSLSEKTLMEVHETNAAALFHHNKHFFMRAYPKGLRITSSNLKPAVFWSAGVQIVALNWQRWDGGMMQNEAMFAGTGGWVLKPEGYRNASYDQTPRTAIPHHNLDLSIEFLAGQDIPLPPEETDPSHLKPYVKVELHTERHGELRSEPMTGDGRSSKGDLKVKTKTYRSTDPDFGREVVEFRGIQGVTEELTFVR